MDANVITGSLSALNDAVVIQAPKGQGMHLEVAGTFVGTILVQGSFDGITWTTVDRTTAGAVSANLTASAITAPGSYALGSFGAWNYVRVIASAWTSGTATFFAGVMKEAFNQPVVITNRLTVTVAGAPVMKALNSVSFTEATAATASQVITGATRDTGAVIGTDFYEYSKFNAFVTGAQTGTIRIEKSADNTNWVRATADVALAANGVVDLSVVITTRYHRVVFTNGALAQTSFLLSSSYSN